MDEHDATEFLRQSVVEFSNQAGRSARDRLRRAVWTYVAEKKASGWPPERVIVELKSIAREEGFSAPLHPIAPSARVDAREKLVTEIVGWCVEQFYQSVG
jgi:hypothetical protein